MSFIIVLLIIALSLFATTYFTKRRFGVLGLALCAGSLISDLWSGEVTAFIEGSGMQLLNPPLSSVVAATLVLLPAVLLLFSGPTYHRRSQRLIGSATFALLSISFLLTAFGIALALDETGTMVYNLLVDNRSLLVTIGIMYALYDILTLKTPKKKDKEK